MSTPRPVVVGATPPQGAGGIGPGAQQIVVQRGGSSAGTTGGGEPKSGGVQQPNSDQGVPQATNTGITTPQVVGQSSSASESATVHQPGEPSGSSADNPTNQGAFFNPTSTPAIVHVDSTSLNGTAVIGGAEQSASVSAQPGQIGLTQAGSLPIVLLSTGILVPNASPTDNSSFAADSGNRRQRAGQGLFEEITLPRSTAPPIDEGESSGCAAEGSFPSTVTLLAESLPLDLTALDEALNRCLIQFSFAPNTLAELVENDAIWPWLAVAAIASGATAAAVSWQARNRAYPPARVLGDLISYVSYDEPRARF